MKKALLFLALLSVIAFTSCKKDDNGLAGTTWIERGDSYTETIRFTAGGNVEIMGRGEYSDWYESGTYTYSAPNITMTTYGDEYDDIYMYTGTVNGNTLLLYDEDYDLYGRYTKQ